MRKLSMILSKSAISADNSQVLGKIVGVLVNKFLKSVDYFVVDIQNGELSDTGYFSPRSIKSINDETVVLSKKLCIKNADEIDLCKYIDMPQNLPAFDSDGKKLGLLCDIFFGDTTKTVESIKIDDKIFAPFVLSLSQDALVLSTSNGVKKRKSAKRKIIKTENVLVKALDDNITYVDKNIVAPDNNFENNDINCSYDSKPNRQNDECTYKNDNDDFIEEPENSDKKAEENNINIEIEPRQSDNTDIPSPSPVALNTLNKTDTSFMPQKIISNYRFLLGRVVTKNIYNYHHRLIIKFGQLVTADVVKLAHKNNKLIELTLCSKS